MELPPFFQEKFAIFEKFPLRYRPWISSLAASLAGLAMTVAYFRMNPQSSGVIEAENVFVKWEASPQDELLFQSMKKALSKVPSLKQKYEPAIVQKLIEIGKGGEAIAMASYSLGKISEEAPFHAAFAETSLLIESGSYQEALQRSVGLKEKMSKEWNLTSLPENELLGGSVLYAHNLLRIACLHLELKNRPGEIAAWDELE